ncbi:UDP-N-acetylglucosamine 2-epimerase (non-hydrolyzing) [Metabacillus fastidiosus]|uniref:UDP-N-acetylglucosamine 2-epimerase (Non-hydrolyzing) n=1 Tax=Metabacillus fastidiosus TaxID=1458 RepID=A0ABU6P1C1_9BACI|nr:UDP-N-acetylglucosamine 2-epimerase (non-hydrolyzing) [Metabacillus fastidiosus]MED4402738.1 UDP-N-acetylglucosamine 2-epimerase (non-hydrolyzing) [Metabacillus fastidiosus]
MKIVTVLGARPQFIKAGPVSREIRKNHEEIIIHTGQHYDANMSDIFFTELNIPKPDYHLNVGSGSHGVQTANMLIQIEEILLKETPDYVLVYGDTNSTLAGSLAASKLHIPIVHVEAGLRSFNKKMPEEVNRILTDHVSSFLFCPSDTSVNNLKEENITKHVYNVGDVMYDAVRYNQDIADKSTILTDIGAASKDYYLITVHRAENTEDRERIENILAAFSQIEGTKVWPIHPRTKNKLLSYGIDLDKIPGLKVIEPIGYLDMLCLEKNAKKILTDSGGVQKEAYFVQTPCVTLRDETEWIETLKDNANVLVGANTEKILEAVQLTCDSDYPPIFGSGNTSEQIVKILSDNQ